jgi:alcohol dehydrogenase class IV
VAKRFEEVLGWISDVFGSLDGLESWAHGEGLPRLSALGVAPQDHAEIAAVSLGASSMNANPVVLGQAELQAILAAAG